MTPAGEIDALVADGRDRPLSAPLRPGAALFPWRTTACSSEALNRLHRNTRHRAIDHIPDLLQRVPMNAAPRTLRRWPLWTIIKVRSRACVHTEILR